MSKEYSQRRFRRYDVSRFGDIASDFSSFGSQKKLMNLSLGGCCFYEIEGSKSLNIRDKVNCQLNSFGQEVNIEAQVVYVNSIRLKDKNVVQYGVEFEVGVRDDLAPIMERLDFLSQTGEVRLL